MASDGKREYLPNEKIKEGDVFCADCPFCGTSNRVVAEKSGEGVLVYCGVDEDKAYEDEALIWGCEEPFTVFYSVVTVTEVVCVEGM